MKFMMKNNFVGTTATTFIIKFIIQISRHAESMEKLKPYIETLLYDCIVPLMFVKEKDVIKFREDPVDFI